MKQRFKNIDLMKGIGTILVVLGHINATDFTKFIYCFHMPLFFAISGFFLTNVEEKSTKEYILSKFKSLMLPYFAFSILTFSYWVFVESKVRNDHFSSEQLLLNIIYPIKEINFVYDVVLWFLLVLFTVSVLIFLLKKYVVKNDFLLLMTSIILFVIIQQTGVWLPFWLSSTIGGAQLFFVIGNFARKYIYDYLVNREKEFSFTDIPLLLFSLLVTVGCTFLNSRVNLMESTYGNPILFIIGGVSGILFIYFLSAFLRRFSMRWLLSISAFSLGIMVVHDPIKRIVIVLEGKLLGLNIDAFRESGFGIVLIGSVTLLISFFVAMIISKYFGFLLSDFSVKNNLFLKARKENR